MVDNETIGAGCTAAIGGQHPITFFVEDHVAKDVLHGFVDRDVPALFFDDDPEFELVVEEAAAFRADAVGTIPDGAHAIRLVVVRRPGGRNRPLSDERDHLRRRFVIRPRVRA
jgi:hypothetical protein